MPRLPRFNLPGIPQHVVQRGNNRQAIFFDDSDCFAYLEWLGQGARAYGVSVHAYVLMTNHVHLLLTPGVSGGIGRLMQFLGRHYVQYVNPYLPAKRHAVGGAVQSLCGATRALLPGLPEVHRAQPGAG